MLFWPWLPYCYNPNLIERPHTNQRMIKTAPTIVSVFDTLFEAFPYIVPVVDCLFKIPFFVGYCAKIIGFTIKYVNFVGVASCESAKAMYKCVSQTGHSKVCVIIEIA